MNWIELQWSQIKYGHPTLAFLTGTSSTCIQYCRAIPGCHQWCGISRAAVLNLATLRAILPWCSKPRIFVGMKPLSDANDINKEVWNCQTGSMHHILIFRASLGFTYNFNDKYGVLLFSNCKSSFSIWNIVFLASTIHSAHLDETILLHHANGTHYSVFSVPISSCAWDGKMWETKSGKYGIHCIEHQIITETWLRELP